jgi:thiosulfate/3-mercaptopyruvate sulfurtransferase
MSGLLVSPQWLMERLGRPGLKVVDGSWYLPAQNRDARREFVAEHIPGAVFFDIDAIADRTTDLPHMLPDEGAFATAAGALGLSDEDAIVVYEGLGLFSAPRVWWTLKVFGAKDVRVLDGGMPAWKQAGLPLEEGPTDPSPALFKARLSREAVRSMAEMGAIVRARSASVVDARPASRFTGEAPEPRPGIPSGHMPGARSLPIDRLVESGRLIAPERVEEAFRSAGVNLAEPVVTTCGSGVTAALLVFALATLGKTDVGLYDGSWAEWASSSGNPIVTGSP